MINSTEKIPVSKTIWPVVILLLFLHACSDDKAVVPEKDVEVEAAQESQPLTLGFEEDDPAPAEPESPPAPPQPEIELAEDAEVDDLFTALDKLVRNAAFTEAWQLARDFRAANPDSAEIGRVDEKINRLNTMRREAPELLYAINQLSDPNPVVRDVAERLLVRSGETVQIILRKKVREADEELCTKAAKILAAAGDMEAFEDILNRGNRSTGELRENLLEMAARLLETADERSIQQTAAVLEKSDSSDHLVLAAALFYFTHNTEEENLAETAHNIAADYLLHLEEVTDDPHTIQAVAATAALSRDEELISEFIAPALNISGNDYSIQTDFATEDLPESDQVTFEFWLFPRRNPGTVIQGNVSGDDERWDITGRSSSSLRWSNHGSRSSHHSIDVELEQWQHIAIAYDKQNTHLTVYINGELESESDSQSAYSLRGEQSLWIGREPGRGGNVRSPDFAIRDIRIWDGIRTENQIRANMTARLSGDEAGLVAYWPLDEGQGMIFNDVVGSRNGRAEKVDWIFVEHLEFMNETEQE